MDIIDFVIPWVDGEDIEWQREKNKHLGLDNVCDTRDIRYRDWDFFKYWFRGVEQCTPWVNKIFFITYGHLPAWLNVKNEKLVIVNHRDYIPLEYLPTFSSHPIELNIHRIKDLSENFVYFNDDMFILRDIKPDKLFKNGLPLDACIESVLQIKDYDIFYHILINNISVINKHFCKRKIIKDNFDKFFNVKYGKRNINNLLLLPWENFVFFQYSHLPQPFLKSVFEEVWEKEGDLLNEVCKNRFRSHLDVNQYLFKYWQYCTGKFIPTFSNAGKGVYKIGQNGCIEAIENRSFDFICLNDADEIESTGLECQKIVDAFDKIFPEKSSFEL